MKKKLCCLFVFLLFGCSAAPKQSENTITYAAAQYCLDDDCKEIIKMEYDADSIQMIMNYIDDLPASVNAAHTDHESARLVLQDEQGIQYTWVETAEVTPSERIYWLKGLNDNHAVRLQSRSLTEFLQTLKGQELPVNADLGYTWLEDFVAVSYSGYYYRDHVENEKLSDVLSLLFYIDEEFDDVNDIQDTPRLLTGLANQIEQGLNYTLDQQAEEYDNYLITSAEAYDQTELENKADELLNNYSLPSLKSGMLGTVIENSYYYDQDRQQVIRHYQDLQLSLLSDWLLLLLKIEENQLQVVKVPVKNRIYNGTSTIANSMPVIDNAVVHLTSNYRDLYSQVVEHLDQFDILDVELDEFHRLKSMHYVHHADMNEKLYPIQNSDFILNKNEENNSVYTLQSLSSSAEYYNNVMRTLNYSIIRSVLKENEQFILIEVSYGYQNNMKTMNFLFDKQDGQLLSDGLLSERYYENKLGERINEQMAKQNIPVCSLLYEENKHVSECYVQPLINDKTDPYAIEYAGSNFKINEKNELYYPVLVREYGTYSRTLEINP